MIQGKVLVTGTTGDTGRATVDELLAHGHRVRALADGQDERSKKLQDFGQVRAALGGVQRAYFVYPSLDAGPPMAQLLMAKETA